MGYASLYAQTAKKQAPTRPQDQTLDKGKGFSMDLSDKKEAIFQGLFDEARVEIEKVYLPGTMAHVREHHKELYENILKIETTLNELWLAMREGRDTLEKFRGALTAWKEFHLRAIELYRRQREPGQGILF